MYKNVKEELVEVNNKKRKEKEEGKEEVEEQEMWRDKTRKSDFWCKQKKCKIFSYLRKNKNGAHKFKKKFETNQNH